MAQTIGLAALAIPSFLLGSLLLAYVSKVFHYNPNAQGFVRLQQDPWLNLQQMLFPALVLGFGLAAPIMRTARSSLLEVQSQDFVRTAHGKGVSPMRIRLLHVLRAALIPIVTMTGIQFGYLLGGAVVVEQIFSIPGMGRQVLLGPAAEGIRRGAEHGAGHRAAVRAGQPGHRPALQGGRSAGPRDMTGGQPRR